MGWQTNNSQGSQDQELEVTLGKYLSTLLLPSRSFTHLLTNSWLRGIKSIQSHWSDTGLLKPDWSSLNDSMDTTAGAEATTLPTSLSPNKNPPYKPPSPSVPMNRGFQVFERNRSAKSR